MDVQEQELEQERAGFEAVNAQRLLAALDGDRELLLELIGLYLRDAPGMCERLRLAAERADATAVALAAHVLKGSVANFGVSPLYESARTFEHRARAGDLSGASEHMARIERRAKAFEAALLRLRRELEP